MRLLTDFEVREEAERLSDALYACQIETEVSEGNSGRFGLWVYDQELMDRARELSDGWRDGAASELEEAAARGRQARAKHAKSAKREQQRAERLQQQVHSATEGTAPALSFGLIGLCLAIHGLRASGSGRTVFALLSFMDVRKDIYGTIIPLGPFEFVWFPLPWDEPWRLVTPILVHQISGQGPMAFLSMHLIFNMLMLSSLGPRLERRHGSLYLGLFVIVSAALSNIAQYEIGGGPGFAGISGVVYGLIGLCWLRQRLQPGMDYGVTDGLFQFAMIWMLLGFLATSMGMANWCHLGGLLVGFAWAQVATRLSRR